MACWKHRFFISALLLGFAFVSGSRRVSGQGVSTGPAGTVVFADNFDDPSSGRLPHSSSNPAFQLGYADGEYQIAKVDPSYGQIPIASVPGNIPDGTIAADARVVGEPASRLVGLICRRQGSPANEYRLSLYPAAGTFSIDREDAGSFTALMAQQRDPSILTDNQTNHLELTCSGTTISASINGTRVASVQDSTYTQGQMALSAGRGSGTSDVRFDNLVVTSTGAAPPVAAASTPTPGVAAPTPSSSNSPTATLPRSDNFSDPNAGLLPKSTQNDQWKVGYLNGEYQVASVASVTVGLWVPIDGAYSDVSIAVDARAVGGPDSPPDQAVSLICRSQPGPSFSGYRFIFVPNTNGYGLGRSDEGRAPGPQPLGFLSTPPVGTATHHLRLTCAGSTISASMDGAQIATLQDSTYSIGRAGLGVASVQYMYVGYGPSGSSYPGIYDVRFSNLVLTQP